MTTVTVPITIGPLFLGTLSEDGYDLQWDTIEGWHSGAGVSLALTSRSASDGAFDSRPTREPRVVSIGGWVRGVDRAATAAGIREVVAVAASKALMPLTVDDPDHGVLVSWVRVSAEPLVKWDISNYATWQLTFTAPDPVLYGPEMIHVLSFPQPAPGSGLQYPLVYPLDYGDPGIGSSSAFISNPGTVPLFLRLRFEGPVMNPRVFVSETGAELRFALTVSAGQWVDVLCRDRQVLANGVVSRRYAVTYSVDWLAIPPGGATVGWDADNNDPAAGLYVWAPEGAWI